MKNIVILILLFCLISTGIQAQVLRSDTLTTKPVDQVIVGQDTITVFELIEVPIVSRPFLDAIDEYQFNALLRNVMSVYPYAHKTIEIIRMIQATEAGMEKNKEKKKYRKQLQETLENEFSDDLKNLNTTQGKILVEWIERQTGKALYETIKENKNVWTAMRYQALGLTFGYNLKDGYDAHKDNDLEMILHAIED